MGTIPYKMQCHSDVLMHYGRSKLDGAPGRGSGRYALGSGEQPYQGKNSSRAKALFDKIKATGNRMSENRKQKKAEKAEKERLEKAQKNPKYFNDQELQNRIVRLQNEKRVRDLERDLKNASRGPVKQYLAGLPAQVLKQIGDKTISKLVDKMFKEKKKEIDPRKLRDSNPEELTSAQLNALNQYYQNLANIANNRYRASHQGRSAGGNNNGNNGNDGNNS